MCCRTHWSNKAKIQVHFCEWVKSLVKKTYLVALFHLIPNKLKNSFESRSAQSIWKEIYFKSVLNLLPPFLACYRRICPSVFSFQLPSPLEDTCPFQRWNFCNLSFDTPASPLPTVVSQMVNLYEPQTADRSFFDTTVLEHVGILLSVTKYKSILGVSFFYFLN